MDEPTNHLDLISSEILIDALEDFNGTLLFVSHNQSFINRLVTKIWDIRENTIIEYPGNLYEYYDHLSKLKMDTLDPAPKEAEEEKKQEDKTPDKIRDSKKAIRKKKAEKRDAIGSKLKPVLHKLSLLEDRIADLEKREKEISSQLTDTELFKDKSKSLLLLDEYGLIRQELERSMLEWEENQGLLEKLKGELGLSDQP